MDICIKGEEKAANRISALKTCTTKKSIKKKKNSSGFLLAIYSLHSPRNNLSGAVDDSDFFPVYRIAPTSASCSPSHIV